MKSDEEAFAPLIAEVTANFFEAMNQDPEKCNGDGCYFGDVCKHKVCSLKLEFVHKPLQKECQELVDQERIEELQKMTSEEIKQALNTREKKYLIKLLKRMGLYENYA